MAICCIRRTISAMFVVSVCGLSMLGATLLCTSNLAADDNLLGLPKPIDPKRPGAVMLHGGGQMTDDAFDQFIALAGGSEARIVFVPSAGYRRDSYADDAEFLAVVSNRYRAWADLAQAGRVREFQFLHADEPGEAADAAFLKPLEEATGVWFSGGFQSRINYSYVGPYPTESKFQTLVRRVVERGGIVGGTSAGMAALPQVMTLWENRLSLTAPAVAVTAHGLGLLTKTVVEQHFDARSGRLERFFHLLRDDARLDDLSGRHGASKQMVGLAVEEHTALIAQNNRLEVLGRGRTHVFLKTQGGRSITWQELRPGEAAQLACDVQNRRNEEIVLIAESEPAPETTVSSE